MYIYIYVYIYISRNKEQSADEIWAFNRILCEKYFFFKNHAETKAGRLVQNLFFKKKKLCKVKASCQHLLLVDLNLTYNKSKLQNISGC